MSIFDGGDPNVMDPWEMWIRATALSQFVREQTNLWPALETLHYIGLSLLLGAIGLFDLRVLGFAKGLAPEFLHKLAPFGVAGFALNVITGICFFFAFPEQYAYNSAFHAKMVFLALAGANVALFYTTAFGAVRRLEAGEDAPIWPKVLTGVSFTAWLAVLICGRLLTFFRPGYFH